MFIEPIDVAIDFSSEFTASHRNRHLSSEFCFECSEESLDDGNAPVLSYGPVAYSDSFPLGPYSKSLAIEDAVAIADDVLGFPLTVGFTQERANCAAVGLQGEYANHDHAT